MAKIRGFYIMCGIAGIINFESKIENHESIVNRFHSDLKHRGPDSCGHFYSSSHNALLCHTRLSIIDISESGNQPIESYDKRFNIVFNGEIYNYKDLSKIISEKFNINTKSDTEILLYMYIEYGSDCLQHISGMFSFAIWDNLKEEVFIARDPLGIKPLYYNFSNNKLSFCSELRPLMRSKQFDCKLNYQAINNYLITGSFHEPDTIIDNISVLKSGHYITYNKNSFLIKDYYKKNNRKKNKDVNRKSALKIIRNSFEKSVHEHLQSDVPTGVFLSGGIDSTAVLSIASKNLKMNTLSIGFQEKQWDESSVSKKIAKYYNTNHHEYIVKEEDAVSSLDDFIQTIDQPTVDGFNTYFISRFTKKIGFKVALSGLGGDELFGGYPSFERMKIMNHYLNIKKNVILNKSLESIIPKRLVGKNNSRLIDMINAKNLFESYIAVRGIFSKKEASEIVKKLSGKTVDNFTKNYYEYKSINSTTRDLELNNYLKNQLLRDSDIFGMKWSIEIRTPFIDKNFVSTIKSLPDKYIFEKNKGILSEALDLPLHIINKKKQGFTFPFESWLKNNLGEKIINYTAPIIDNDNKWFKIWTVYILKKWIEKNKQYL